VLFVTGSALTFVSSVLTGGRILKYFGSDVAMHLTPRELEVLKLVAEGSSAKEVALELHIAPCTVERHIENARLKTRTRNRAHMIAVAMQGGWLAVAH